MEAKIAGLISPPANRETSQVTEMDWEKSLMVGVVSETSIWQYMFRSTTT